MPLAPRLVVELFNDTYFRGKKVTVINDVDNTEKVGAHDSVSSVKIYKGPGFNASPNYKVVFFEHINFKGRKLVLSPGFFPNIHDIPYNFGDIISSIEFSPAAHPTPPEYGYIPVIIEAYRDIEFQGQQNIIMRDISDVNDIGMDNAISSLRIQRGPDYPFGGCQVMFYEKTNYEGQKFSVNLGTREFRKEFRNLNEQNFGDVISSIKIIPKGSFRVLIIIGDNRTSEPGILESITHSGGQSFEYETIKVNPNPDNYGDQSNAKRLSSVNLKNFDIIWFTWNAPGHDLEYFIEDADRNIVEFVRKGGVVWASAMDDRIVPPDGDRIKEPMWKGNWLPVDRHPIKVVNSEDVDVQITNHGWKTGMFNWPNKIDVNALTTDDHWVTKDWSYEILARRKDEEQDPVSFQLPWGDGYYVAFALDTRDATKASVAKTFIENVLYYLASLAWRSSPRKPLSSRYRASEIMRGTERQRFLV